MDINQHLQKIVEGLIAEISCNVVSNLDSVVSSMIQQKLLNFDFETYIKEAANNSFEKKISTYNLDSKKLENKIIDKINTTIDNVRSDTVSNIQTSVKAELEKLDVRSVYRDAITNLLSNKLENYNFPEKSIDGNAINFDNFIISGNNIVGGIIKNFSSVGIDDRSTQVALTILDHATVIENNLLTQNLTVEGSVTINGNFELNGDVPDNSNFLNTLVNKTSTSVLGKLDNTLFDRFSQTIFNKIKEDGLDLSKISLNGSEIIKENSLASKITESNLQKLGSLKELQVSGESLLSDTLYTTNKRVGINTIEPSAALSVWDDEVEIVFQKKLKDTAYIGTTRKQKVILSSNSKDNIVLDHDGSVSVSHLKIGAIRFTSSESPPNFVSEKGHIVWNANPNPGGPMGWVCFGSSNWANFGIID
jgi:hypothetical protein